jgi:hypothetical protein
MRCDSLWPIVTCLNIMVTNSNDNTATLCNQVYLRIPTTSLKILGMSLFINLVFANDYFLCVIHYPHHFRTESSEFPVELESAVELSI